MRRGGRIQPLLAATAGFCRVKIPSLTIKKNELLTSNFFHLLYSKNIFHALEKYVYFMFLLKM